MDTGVARKPIEDMEAYKKSLVRRQDPTAAILQGITASVQAEPKTIIFAEGMLSSQSIYMINYSEKVSCVVMRNAL